MTIRKRSVSPRGKPGRGRFPHGASNAPPPQRVARVPHAIEKTLAGITAGTVQHLSVLSGSPLASFEVIMYGRF